MSTISNRCYLLLFLITLGSCMAPMTVPLHATGLKQSSVDPIGGTFAGWLGGTSMKSSDWEPLEDQFLIGFDGQVGPASWPIKPEFGFQVHGDSRTINVLGTSVDVDATFIDAFIGVGTRFSGPDSTISITVGGGLVITDAEVNAEIFGLTSTISDTTTGFYLHGGPAVMLNDDVELGIDARFVFASDFDFNGARASADSSSVALVLRVIF